MYNTDELSKFLSIPALWTPNMVPEEYEQEVDRMIVRQSHLAKLCDGTITAYEFAEVLDATGIDPVGAEELWMSGWSFLA